MGTRPHAAQFRRRSGGRVSTARPTLFGCGHFYQVSPGAITGHYGSVTTARRREVARKIIAAYRLPL